MGGAAALPVMLGVSAGANVLGSALSANAAKPKQVPVSAPAPLFPGVQDSYVTALQQSGVPAASFGAISEAARTGLPTDVGPAFEAMKVSQQRLLDEGRSNVIEKYGPAGYGSTGSARAVDFETQATKDFSSILADFTRQASEAAANRRLQAASIGQAAAGELAGAFRPTSVIASGSPSVAGSAISSGASSLQNFMIMKAIFPDLFKAGTGGGGSDVVTNLPGSIGTGDYPTTPPFVGDYPVGRA